MRHPVFSLMHALDTLQRCTRMHDAQKLDVRTKICDLMQQCITSTASAYDFQADAACPCMYTQVQEIGSLVQCADERGECAVERELQLELQEISSMLLTTSLTGCLQRPLPCDSLCAEWMQNDLRSEIVKLTCH
jgi:hypothetical protein